MNQKGEFILTKNKAEVNGKNYFYEINFIRAIACLCVVMVHVTAGYYYENDKTFDMITQFFNQITRYGTPAFAIISGFLLNNQLINKRFKMHSFLKSRLTKIVIPFVIWSFIYLILKTIYGYYSFPSWNIVEIKEFIYFFSIGKAHYHLYFISVVIQFYIIFILLRYLHSKNSLLILTIAAFFLNYFFIELKFNFGSGVFNNLMNERAFIFRWIFYFLFGGLLVYYWHRIVAWVKKNIRLNLLIVAVVMIAGCFEYKYTGFLTSTRTLNLINLPLLFIALTGVYFALKRFENIRDIFIRIGNFSMGIYLVHPFVLFFLREYDIFKFLYKSTWYLPLLFLFTLAASLLIVKLISILPLGNYVVTVASLPNKNLKTQSANKMHTSFTSN